MKKIVMALTVLTLLLGPAMALAQEARGSGPRIDLIISPKEIVIDDTSYKIAAGAVFLGRDGLTPLSFSAFHEKDLVEFGLNAQGEIDLLQKSEGR
jgi:hypothetical protein